MFERNRRLSAAGCGDAERRETNHASRQLNRARRCGAGPVSHSVTARKIRAALQIAKLSLANFSVEQFASLFRQLAARSGAKAARNATRRKVWRQPRGDLQLRESETSAFDPKFVPGFAE